MSAIWDAGKELLDIAQTITCNVYVDGKGKKGLRKDLTLKKCIELLQSIELSAYLRYDELADELGWNGR